MSAPPDPTPTDDKPPRSGRRILLLAIALAVFVALGVAWGAYWLLIGRYFMSTDNAYVAGHVIQVTPQVGGTIVAIYADDTDFVHAGQKLVTLDDSDAKLTLDRTRSELAQTIREVRTLFVNDGALAAAVEAQEATLARLKDDLARRQRLANTGAISAEELKHAKNSAIEAEAQLTKVRQQQASNRALIDGATVAAHPRVVLAATKLREAYLAWRRTEVLAPVSGQIAHRSAQLGQRTSPGVSLMSIAPLDQLWVDANFKESQMSGMRIGQPVEMVADLYGGGVVYHGTVAGFSAGSGAAFSLLPAQNASGNWIKIVQRVPVRITLDPKDLMAHPLRIGLSMEANVDITDQSGTQLSSKRQLEDGAETSVYSNFEAEADALISEILGQNTGDGGGDQAAPNADKR